MDISFIFKESLSLIFLVSQQFQAQVSGTEVCNSSDKVLKSDSKPTVVYKPLAKLVSKTTVSLLANLVSIYISWLLGCSMHCQWMVSVTLSNFV